MATLSLPCHLSSGSCLAKPRQTGIYELLVAASTFVRTQTQLLHHSRTKRLDQNVCLPQVIGIELKSRPNRQASRWHTFSHISRISLRPSGCLRSTCGQRGRDVFQRLLSTENCPNKEREEEKRRKRRKKERRKKETRMRHLDGSFSPAQKVASAPSHAVHADHVGPKVGQNHAAKGHSARDGISVARITQRGTHTYGASPANSRTR